MTTVQIIANPAVTIGRAFTDTFAGIAPASVPGFIAAQLVGLAVGVAALIALYPTKAAPEPATTPPAPQRTTVDARSESRGSA